MQVQSINNINRNYNTDFSSHLRVPNHVRVSKGKSYVHYPPKWYLGSKVYNSKAEYEAASKRQVKVMHGSIIAGVGQFSIGSIPYLFSPDPSLCFVNHMGASLILGAITALGGMIFSQEIADFLHDKGILK